MDKLLNPQNKRDQIVGVLQFYFPKEPFLPEHCNLVEGIQSTALLIFRKEPNSCTNYRATVIRNALNELALNGFIDYDEAVYTMES